MRSVKTIQRDLLRATGRALAALFIIPVLLWMVTGYALHQNDVEYRMAVAHYSEGTVESRNQSLTALRETPPSGICWATGDDELDAFREQFCPPLSPQWQLAWANRISKIMVAGGVLLLLASAGLGLAAFRNRAAQYRSVVAGARLLVAASVVGTVVQSAMLAWLAFALPANFWNQYASQLAILAAMLASVAAGIAIRDVFRRQPDALPLEGEIVTAQDAPALWARIGELAARLGTAPPRHVVAGIDSNFFVTESALRVAGRSLHGRTLFVSLPLLRILDTEEADALLAHELAHMQDGDTASLAGVRPALSRFDQRLASMKSFGATIIAISVLRLYRVILELALRKESREREFIADLVAARHTSPSAVARALIKVSGYGAYRRRVDVEVFSRERRFNREIGLAASVADGLRPFAYSAGFMSHMARACVPHPFDTHPSLIERMGSVGAPVDEAEYSAVLLARGSNAWIDAMPGATHIEGRLWEGHHAPEASCGHGRLKAG